MPENVLDPSAASTPVPTDVHASAIAKALRYLRDCLFILPALPIVLPMMAVVAILIKVSSPGPVLLRLRTLGLNGKVFYQYRFRTMKCGAPQAVWGREVGLHDNQITQIGRFLIVTGLSILPQLFNVLRGDMVLVGPPALALAHIGSLKGTGHRLRCKPGIICG